MKEIQLGEGGCGHGGLIFVGKIAYKYLILDDS